MISLPQSRTIRASAVLLVGALSQTALAQTFFGLDHSTVGNADLEMTADGLSIRNLGATGKDGVDICMPPPSGSSRMGWFGHVRGLRQPALDTGIRLACSGVGPSGIPEEACSMLVSHVAGIPSVTFDFSSIQPGAVRVVYYSHGQVLLEEVLPAPVAGPFPISGVPVSLDPLIPLGISAHLDFTCHCWVFDWTWDTSRMTTLGGSELLGCDHVEVHAETPAVQFSSFDTLHASFTGVSEVMVTTELIEAIDDVSACDLAPPFGQLDFSDVVQFLQCFSGG